MTPASAGATGPRAQVTFSTEPNRFVVLANSDLTDKLGVANLASISVRADILSSLEVGLRFIPESGSASTRDHRALSSDRCSLTLCEAGQADARRSTLVGMALYGLGGLEVRGLHHEGLHRCRLAPQGLSPVLDLEDSTQKPGRPSVPKQVRELIRTLSREPAVGSSADSWRVAQTWHRDR
jgi:hypothetical protein